MGCFGREWGQYMFMYLKESYMADVKLNICDFKGQSQAPLLIPSYNDYICA